MNLFSTIYIFFFLRDEGAVGGNESTLACVDDISHLR